MKKLIAGVIFLVFICVAGLIYYWAHSLQTKIFVGKSSDNSKKEIIYKTVEEKINNKVPFGIALLGYAGGTHDGASLTDSIIVALVDPKLKKILLISIPRDLFIKVPSRKEDDYRKINIAYIMGFNDTQFPDKPDEYKSTNGEGKVVEHVLSEVTGVPVDYFVSLDFSGFTKTIDTLGGVTVNVERTLDDYEYPLEGKEKETCDHSEEEINAYMATASADPTTKYSEFFPCRYEHLHIDVGSQNMDGATALKYVRSRHSEQDGSDFARAGRQRNLMLAVKDKVLSIGFVSKIVPFISSLGDDVRTDMTPDDVKTLIAKANELNDYKIETLALTDQNYLKLDTSQGGQSIVIPREGMNQYGAIHRWIKDTLSGKKAKVPPLVLLQNGTTTPGLAAKAKENLKKQGIESLPPTSAETQDHKLSEMTIYGKDVETAQVEKIKKEFNVSKVKNIEEKSPNGIYNVLVVIGEDYVNE